MTRTFTSTSHRTLPSPCTDTAGPCALCLGWVDGPRSLPLCSRPYSFSLLEGAAPAISSSYSSISFSLSAALFPSMSNPAIISPTVNQSEEHSLDLTSPCSYGPISVLSVTAKLLKRDVSTPRVHSSTFRPMESTPWRWLWPRSPVNSMLVTTTCLASGVLSVVPLKPIPELHLCKTLRLSQRKEILTHFHPHLIMLRV